MTDTTYQITDEEIIITRNTPVDISHEIYMIDRLVIPKWVIVGAIKQWKLGSEGE